MDAQQPIVLFIDDEEHNLTVFKGTFRRHYTIHAVLSGHEALELLKEQPVHVVIVDQRMPRMSGVEFLQEIIPLYPDIVRIVLTGFSDVGAVISAINDAGVYRYITKPWTEHDLKMTIDSAVEYYHLQLENKALMLHLSEYNQRLEQTVQQRTWEIQSTNAELHEANAQLKELNKEKDEFMGIAAHDLKNPLNGIMGLASMIETVPDLSREQVEDFARMIVSSSQRMFDLISRLLDINAIEQGNLNLTIVHCSLATTVENVVENFRPRALKKDIALHYVCEASSTIILADEVALMQIVENLVSNAVKYSPQGRSVWVSVLNAESSIHLCVKDEGPGISAEDQTKLFGKFMRLTAQPTGGEDSTGLGLSIVKRMVEAMNGSVWCESELGHGATFVVAFPLTD